MIWALFLDQRSIHCAEIKLKLNIANDLPFNNASADDACVLKQIENFLNALCCPIKKVCTTRLSVSLNNFSSAKNDTYAI